MKRYRSDWNDVVEVECEKRGHPHLDADGQTQYVNTHWDTPQQAWDSVISNCIAGVSLAASDVTQAERALVAAREKAGKAAQALTVARERMQKAGFDVVVKGRKKR